MTYVYHLFNKYQFWRWWIGKNWNQILFIIMQNIIQMWHGFEMASYPPKKVNWAVENVTDNNECFVIIKNHWKELLCYLFLKCLLPKITIWNEYLITMNNVTISMWTETFKGPFLTLRNCCAHISIMCVTYENIVI